ncbi:unnamed protein product [Ilex paraguariensis]|uniref:Ovate family protein n=1 Tax=Ilex paraguariensis TaxID=185542 RepID=A0ABC8T5W0_9AQUA
MKVSSKPILCPSKTEKFHPPLLMRFLTSNVDSKSRGRSRSSPMLVPKKNVVIETTQEPSSPKVTCIGHVRVRRSSKNSGNRTSRSRTPAKRRLCWWLRKTVFPYHFAKFHKPNSFRPVWRKWVLFFRFGYCKKVDVVVGGGQCKASDSASDAGNGDEDVDEEEAAQVEEYSEVLDSSEPPKNAFLLTRCRSAPYRSSSLASKFWGSPLSKSETGDGEIEVNRGLEQL